MPNPYRMPSHCRALSLTVAQTPLELSLLTALFEVLVAVKLIAMAAYAALVIYIGIVGSKKTKSFNDFLLGGGSVGPWMTAFSYGTAYFSAVLFIGFAGKIGWEFGLSGLWIAVGNTFIGITAVWFLMGKRIKNYAVTHKVATMPELLEHRYGSRFMKGFTSAAIFVFMIPYTAAVFMGLSYLFQTTFGMQYEYVMLFMGVFTAIYLTLGGYKSMALIDIIFGMIMTVGVCVLFFCCLYKGGGMGDILSTLHERKPGLTDIIGPPGFWPLFSLVLLTSIAPLAMPQLVQKFYAIKDERSIRIGAIASTVFSILVTGVAYFTGALTRVFVTPEANKGAFDAAGKPIYDSLMPELLNSVIPEALTVVILLLILSASMSTLAALVLISASTVTKDFYAGFVNRNASDSTLTKLMRYSSVAFIVLAIGLALMRPAVIVTILVISWGALASVFLGPFALGLLTKFVNRAGAIAGGVGGLIVCLSAFFIWGEKFVPQAGVLGMAASLLFTAAFSALIPTKPLQEKNK